jgi:hypothetical protein
LQWQTICGTIASVSTGEESFYVTADATDEKVSICIIVYRSICNLVIEEVEGFVVIGLQQTTRSAQFRFSSILKIACIVQSMLFGGHTNSN